MINNAHAHDFRETARLPWATLALCKRCGVLRRMEHETGRCELRFIYKGPGERDLKFTREPPACVDDTPRAREPQPDLFEGLR